MENPTPKSKIPESRKGKPRTPSPTRKKTTASKWLTWIGVDQKPVRERRVPREIEFAKR